MHLPLDCQMNVNRSILSIGLIFMLLAAMAPNLVAQHRASSPAKPHSCEDALLYLDMIALEARKFSQGYIIVIARLGQRENSMRLNKKRLKSANAYLGGKVENKIVAAYGERAKGFGQLEFYVNGKLLYVLAYPRNVIIDCSGLG
jgi:hypothetical protein